MKISILKHVVIATSFVFGSVLLAQVPQLINYQGRIAVAAENFTGEGQFKFALVDANGASSYWSNDGLSSAGSEPVSSVTLTVSDGLYSVLLGDTGLANMTAIPAGVFTHSDVYVRVWFNDGSNGSQLLTPDQRIASVGYAILAGEALTVADGAITSSKIATGAVTADGIATGAITADKIAAGSLTEGLATEGSVIVASGPRPDLVGAGFFQVGTLAETNPWGGTTTINAPSGRSSHTAVWTGTEMIVWGGSNSNPGWRYDPSTDTWTATSATNAPDGVSGHTAIWTGSEMIVWGGTTSNPGGRYDPATDRWSATTAINAPSEPRRFHTAVWTGSEMIVWGGSDGRPSAQGTGGRYDSATVYFYVKP